MSSSDYLLQNVFDLKGFVALVTGGGTGIGIMIAKGLAANGAKVYIGGRRAEVLQKVADSWDGQNGGSLIPIQIDVTSKESIQAAKQVLQEKEGKLHILVNNAGQVGPTSPWLNKDSDSLAKKDAELYGNELFKESDKGWGDLYAINTFSIFFVTSAFLGMLSRASEETPGPWTASVINITSISGVIRLAQEHFCYNSAKAAASHLTKTLSTEFALAGFQVRVNSIAPGVYASEMTQAVISPEETDKTGKGVMPVPARRAGTEQEMAGTAIYLASIAGCYTNGQEIVIDGGYCAVNPTA